MRPGRTARRGDVIVIADESVVVARCGPASRMQPASQ